MDIGFSFKNTMRRVGCRLSALSWFFARRDFSKVGWWLIIGGGSLHFQIWFSRSTVVTLRDNGRHALMGCCFFPVIVFFLGDTTPSKSWSGNRTYSAHIIFQSFSCRYQHRVWVWPSNLCAVITRPILPSASTWRGNCQLAPAEQSPKRKIQFSLPPYWKACWRRTSGLFVER